MTVFSNKEGGIMIFRGKSLPALIKITKGGINSLSPSHEGQGYQIRLITEL